MKNGDTLRAEVVDVRENGLFLRAEGLAGFVNVTEITWTPGPVSPADFAKVGETIAVRVYAVAESGFHASLKALDPLGDPFRDHAIYEPGARHRGRVWGLRLYGVFVLLESGALGLLTAADVAEATFEIGASVEVVVVSFDGATGKLELRLA